MKYYGKEKCRILKEIRAEIAKQNDIEWVVSECRHQGNCKGTCPKCEQEVRELEEALAKREALGKKVAVVGISATLALSVTGCVNPFAQTQGDMQVDGEPWIPDTSAEVTTAAIAGGMPPPETDTDELVIKGEIIPGADTCPVTEEETTDTDTDTDGETTKAATETETATEETVDTAEETGDDLVEMGEIAE